MALRPAIARVSCVIDPVRVRSRELAVVVTKQLHQTTKKLLKIKKQSMPPFASDDDTWTGLYGISVDEDDHGTKPYAVPLSGVQVEVSAPNAHATSISLFFVFNHSNVLCG